MSHPIVTTERGATTSARWAMLGVIFLTRASLGFMFQSIAALTTFLVPAFELTYAEVGLLMGLPDVYRLPPPAVPYATTMSDAPDGLRIGYVESVEAIGVTVAADCVEGRIHRSAVRDVRYGQVRARHRAAREGDHLGSAQAKQLHLQAAHAS